MTCLGPYFLAHLARATMSSSDSIPSAAAVLTQSPRPAMPPSRSYRRRRSVDVRPGIYVVLSTEMRTAATSAAIDHRSGNKGPSLRLTVSDSEVKGLARVPLTAYPACRRDTCTHQVAPVSPISRCSAWRTAGQAPTVAVTSAGCSPAASASLVGAGGKAPVTLTLNQMSDDWVPMVSVPLAWSAGAAPAGCSRQPNISAAAADARHMSRCAAR